MKEVSTKEKILTAARKLFAEHGFAGTSIGSIAKSAEVNHSLIFHHYENKEKLWIAVKQNIVEDANLKSKTLPDTNIPFKKFLQALIKNSIEFYRNNPDIIRMINWQRLESHSEQNIGVTLTSETHAWINAFKHYQKNGNINSKIKPEYIVTFILSIVSSASLDPNVFIKNQDDLQNYINFCINSMLKAFE